MRETTVPAHKLSYLLIHELFAKHSMSIEDIIGMRYGGTDNPNDPRPAMILAVSIRRDIGIVNNARVSNIDLMKELHEHVSQSHGRRKNSHSIDILHLLVEALESETASHHGL